MFFSKKASKKALVPTPLPSNWPSRLHHKCSSPSCRYPNPPQAAAGLYNCSGGTRHGFVCGGTYVVSQVSADQTMRNFHDSLAREETKRRATESLQRRTAQRKRPDVKYASPTATSPRRPQPSFEQMHHTQRHRQAHVQQVPVQMAHQPPHPGAALPPTVAHMLNTRRTPVPTTGQHTYESYSRRF